MAKPELGTKRLCGSCGAKFYDLSKSPIVCPKCGTIFEVVVPVSRAKPDAARAAMPAAAAVVAEAAETQDAEFVSLEDADAEAQGKKTAMPDDVDLAEDDVEVADDDDMDDAALIEEEEGDADVTDIIGDGIEKEEET
ncbi:MAG: TIGR02300 family protein [Pseudorhodoplanes sp.]|nr:TIGR02300 family protein [Pseudorhodoplanes sp.]